MPLASTGDGEEIRASVFSSVHNLWNETRETGNRADREGEQGRGGPGPGSWWGDNFSLPFCAFWILKLGSGLPLQNKHIRSSHCANRYFRPGSGSRGISCWPSGSRVQSPSQIIDTGGESIDNISYLLWRKMKLARDWGGEWFKVCLGGAWVKWVKPLTLDFAQVMTSGSRDRVPRWALRSVRGLLAILSPSPSAPTPCLKQKCFLT